MEKKKITFASLLTRLNDPYRSLIPGNYFDGEKFITNKDEKRGGNVLDPSDSGSSGAVNESVEHPMIDVDGVQKHRHNSDGKPIHPTEEGIKNFHRWFGDSKAVDEHGRPLVMYHGTSKDLDFDKFKVGARGAFFTSNQESASDYAEENDSQKDQYNPDTRRYEKVHSSGRVMPVYLKVTTPYSLTNEDRSKVNVGNYAKAQRELFSGIKGHDGVLWNNALTKEWVVLAGSHQIKSAIGNDGTFDHPTKIHESNEYSYIHYSHQPRTHLDPTKHGTGISDAADKRLVRDGLDRSELKNRVYFYLKKGDQLPPKEAGIGNVAHEIFPSSLKMLDFEKIDNDEKERYNSIKSGIIQKTGVSDASAHEMAVKQMGYDGYVNNNYGFAVAIRNEPIPVDKLHP